MNQEDLFRVGPSPIHGMGLFAAQRIAAGQIIGRIEGMVRTEDGPHVLWVSEHFGVEVTNAMRFINHDENPNACYYDDMTVAALRDIEAGEEITHHYGAAWLETEAAVPPPEPCEA